MFNDLVFAQMMKLMKNKDKNLVNIEVYPHVNNPLSVASFGVIILTWEIVE